MSYPPEALVAEGYTYLAGLEGTSGAALGRWGPNLFALRFDDTVAPSGAMASVPLVAHDSEERAPEGWWIGNFVSDVEWIETETRHGVLFLLYRGLGETWYGEASEGGDRYEGGRGYHAEGYAQEAWIYDPADLLEVAAGARDPWSVTPVEEVLLVDRQPGSDAEERFSFIEGSAQQLLRLSMRDGRMIILQPFGNAGEYESMPRGYVLEIN